MIPLENVQAGIVKFIDREIAPSLSGWDKVLVAGAGGLLTAKLPNVISQYAENPMLKAMEIYDQEHGMVDVDALYNAAKPYIGTEPMPIKIPVVKMTMKVGKKELDTLYKYIQEGV